MLPGRKKSFYAALILLILTSIVIFIDLQQKNISEQDGLASDFQDWNGVWSGGQYWVNGHMVINSSTKNGFHFKIDAQSGGNIGELEGEAKIVSPDTLAIADVTDVSDNSQDSLHCHLSFIKTGDKISLADSEPCSYWAGMGVSFSFNYLKNYRIPTPGVANLLALQSKALRDSFQALVGNDLNLFLESSMGQDYQDNLDSFPATSVASGVAHLYSISENIIMTTPDNKIWAAVIDPASDPLTIKYFTNVTKNKKQPPKTIKDWISRFDYKVIYMP